MANSERFLEKNRQSLVVLWIYSLNNSSRQAESLSGFEQPLPSPVGMRPLAEKDSKKSQIATEKTRTTHSDYSKSAAGKYAQAIKIYRGFERPLAVQISRILGRRIQRMVRIMGQLGAPLPKIAQPGPLQQFTLRQRVTISLSQSPARCQTSPH